MKYKSIVKLLKSGLTEKNISMCLNVSLNQISRIKQKIREGKPLIYERKGTKPELSKAQVEILSEIVHDKSNYFKELKKIKECFLKKAGLDEIFLKLPAFRKFIKKKLNISFKKVFPYKPEKKHSKK